MVTQIYEAIDEQEGRALVEADVDLIGVVADLKGDYPGVLDIIRANDVFRIIGNDAKKVLLPFSEHLKEIYALTNEIQPDILHIAAGPEIISPSDIQILKAKFPKVKIMRTIPVENEHSIDIAKSYDGVADYILLDSRSKKNNQIGITGETHDWNISRKIVEHMSIPVILAGGIGPDNVAEAISKVRPYGVDSKTKTDVQGTNRKDFEKVRKFVSTAKATELALLLQQA